MLLKGRITCLLMMSCLVGLGASSRAYAWTFPEHTAITERALRKLEREHPNPVASKILDDVRAALKLCTPDAAGDGEQRCPTLAVLPSLAADHSCTPDELGQMLLGIEGPAGDWIPDVLEIAERTQRALDAAGNRVAEREAARRQMHVDLQGADTEYLSRAMVDWSHFQLARESDSIADLRGYLRSVLAPTRLSNATASYVNFHLVALRLAARARVEASAEVRLQLLVRAVLAEAFAVHFLQDSFSSGHFVGHFGDPATRLGTHDYYSAIGVTASRWNAPTKTYVAYGDAFMSDAENDVVTLAVVASLHQVLQAATDEAAGAELIASTAEAFDLEGYDTCRDQEVPPGLSSLVDNDAMQQVVAYEPVPSARFPALQRVRAEKGFFFGVAGSGLTAHSVIERAWLGGFGAAFRAGFGAADLVTDPLNAQAFLELGFAAGTRANDDGETTFVGYSARFRAPGYLTAVDGAIAVLLANSLEADCPFCLTWATAAAGGGLGGLWKSRPLSSAISWQISALRDVTVRWFRNHPRHNLDRIELLLPALTARHVLPIVGEHVSQSTDVYVDIGPSFTWREGHESPIVGGFLSLAVATRVFP